MTGPRVAVRHRLPDGRVTDVVGHVLEESSEVVVVRPDDAPAVAVPAHLVVARRVVPERPVRPASSPDKLERLLSDTWPGREQERLGGWLLRAGAGVTRRANSALTCGDPGLDAAAARTAASRWYTDRGLRPCLAVVGEPDPPAGWQAVGTADVLVGDLRTPGDPQQSTAPADRGPRPPDPPTVGAGDRTDAGTEPHERIGGVAAAAGPSAARPGDGTDGLDLAVTEDPDASWTAMWRGGAAGDPGGLAELTAAPARYLTLSVNGTTVACARVAITRRWAVLSCVTVVPTHRGRGRGRAVCTAALDLARVHGAAWVAVQVEVQNAPARALYATLGLRPHHRYHYLEPAD